MRNAAGQKKRQRLLDAALRVFEERGFTHSKIEDIAGAAEVARTSFYFYFPTKDDVLALLLEEAETAILAQWKPVPGAALAETLGSFERQLAAYWGTPQRRHLLPEVFRVQVKRCDGFVTTRCAYIELLMPVFAEALRRGEVGTALPVDRLAGTYVRTCFAALGNSMSEKSQPLEVLLARSTSLLLRGCAA